MTTVFSAQIVPGTTSGINDVFVGEVKTVAEKSLAQIEPHAFDGVEFW